MKSLSGKVVLITGAASGIGRGTALAMSRAGARLVLGDINAEGVQETASLCGSDALALQLDVSQPEALAQIRQAAIERFGQVDVVMNNVGVLVSGLPEDIPLSEWERIINLNLMSVVRAIHLFIPDMVSRAEGHIVNTASFAGLFPYAFDRLPYAATKAAIVALSEGLALYLKPQGVGVTCLCPGPVRTAIGATMKSWTPGLTLRGPGSQFAFLDADTVGEMVVEAVLEDRFFLPTDGQVVELMARRGADLDEFLNQQIAAQAGAAP